MASFLLRCAVRAGFFGLAISCLWRCGAPPALSEAEIFSQRNIATFGLRGTKQIALTFDDGPNRATYSFPEGPQAVTDRMLDVLEENGVLATFFLVGGNVRGRDDALVKRMRMAGHEIANHTRSHVALNNIPLIEVVAQIQDTHTAISPYLSGAHRLYFRAPFGAWRSANADTLNTSPLLRQYIGPIFWDIGGAISGTATNPSAAADWDCWGRGWTVDQCLAGYLRETERLQGGVVLVHDIHPRTVLMVQKMIPRLVARGYDFITLDAVRALDAWEADPTELWSMMR